MVFSSIHKMLKNDTKFNNELKNSSEELNNDLIKI